MMHIINGCKVHLRGLTDANLAILVECAQARQQRVQDELDSLVGEQYRRSFHPGPSRYDLPQQHLPFDV